MTARTIAGPERSLRVAAAARPLAAPISPAARYVPIAAPFHRPAPVPADAVAGVMARIQKPGRYSGGEWNSVTKDWAAVALKWCFAYPDLYEIGMSNLGLKILYEVLNERPDRLAERCFAPWVDLQAELGRERLPLWSLETRRALRDFDVLGFSLGYELTYTNLLDMLALGGVGLTTAERAEDDPLVLAGGTTTLNPEPISDVLDAVVLGEGEEAVLEISDLLERLGWHRREVGPDGRVRRGAGRRQVLRALARVPGVYVPSLYRPHYLQDGTCAGMERHDDGVPARVTRRIVADFETNVRGIRQLVPNIGIVFDRAQMEVMRGCTRGCRFCQAGMQYRPLRERAPEVALEAAEAILAATGYEEIGLTSLSTADYTYVKELATELHRRHPDVTVSMPSTRVDAFTVELTDAIERGRRAGFTFAPEAGSQRLRDVINKGVSDEEIERTAELAFSRGWSTLKLYFMIGLPSETMDDVLGIAAICRRLLAIGRRHHNNRALVKANVSTFVPKVLTPFLWAGQDTTEEIEAKVRALRGALHGRGLDLSWHDTRNSLLEAALSRGDRRLNGVVRRAWEKGARFDAWDEQFRFDLWLEAFEEAGLDPRWYGQRDIPLDEHLPWEHLDGGVTKRFLQVDYGRAAAGKTVEDCHWGACYDCGVPEATGFACQTGEAGPRGLLVQLDRDEGRRRWQYVGPPGDPRRTAGDGTPWPRDLLGTDVQSKNAGLSGLASLVGAAGGERGG
ncbi:MAG: TIGR03960 family B12-binding radical SAM protein [Candidatus Limnocylindrales bacterium]